MESTPPLTKKKMLRSPGDRADLVFDRVDLAGGVPILVAAADVEQEIRKNRLAAGRVRDFGMKLDGEQAARGRGHGGDGAGFGAGQHVEAGRRGDDVSRWLIQTCCGPAMPRRIASECADFELGEAVFAMLALLNIAAKQCAMNCWP